MREVNPNMTIKWANFIFEIKKYITFVNAKSTTQFFFLYNLLEFKRSGKEIIRRVTFLPSINITLYPLMSTLIRVQQRRGGRRNCV